MTSKRKASIVIYVCLGLILALVGGGVFYYLFQSREKVATLKNALETAERGDRERAIELFSQALAKDPANEKATVKLAELVEETGNWALSSLYWQKAANLNTLKPEYEAKMFDNLLRARLFQKTATLLEAKLVKEATEEQRLIYIYSLLMSNQQQKGSKLWEEMLAENPMAVETAWGKLIRVKYFAENQTFEWAFQELAELQKDASSIIVQEALIVRANLNQMARQYKDEEEDLKTLLAENNYVGAPLLGEFYANHLMYSEAIDLLEPYLERYSDGHLALLLGEMMVFTKQQDRLANFAQTWRNTPGRNNLMVSYYLDTLQAFMKKDFDQMVRLFRPVADQLQTPLSTYIAMLCDVQTNNTTRLTRDLQRFAEYPPLFDLRNRAHNLVILYLQERVKSDTTNGELALLADAILAAHLSDQGIYTPRLIVIFEKLKNNTLTEGEMAQLLKDYSDDPICLEIAASFYYVRGNYDLAWQYLRKLEQLSPTELSHEARLLAVAVLGAQGKTDEVASRILALLEDAPKGTDFPMAFRFFFTNQRASEMRRLAEIAETRPELHDEFLPAIQTAVQLLDGEKDKALAALQSLDTKIDLLKDFAGTTLAENGLNRQAVEKLAAISPNYPEYVKICVKLSQLYAQEEEWDSAIEKAKEAVRLAPLSPEANLCLAKCLRNSQNWRQTLSAIKPFLWKTAEPTVAQELREIWTWAMENSIQNNFENKMYPLARQLCRELLEHAPDNPVATEYSAKIDEQLASDANQTSEQKTEMK